MPVNNQIEPLNVPSVTTTNNTPTDQVLPLVGEDSELVGLFLVVAKDQSNGDAAVFGLLVGGKRVGSANLSLIGLLGGTGTNPVVLILAKDLGAATWTCALAISGGSPAIRFTGQNGKTIKWSLFGFMGIPHA